MSKKRIVIDCPYTVYDDEWEELRNMINGILSGSKYTNMKVAIESAED